MCGFFFFFFFSGSGSQIWKVFIFLFCKSTLEREEETRTRLYFSPGARSMGNIYDVLLLLGENVTEEFQGFVSGFFFLFSSFFFFFSHFENIFSFTVDVRMEKEMYIHDYIFAWLYTRSS